MNSRPSSACRHALPTLTVVVRPNVKDEEDTPHSFDTEPESEDLYTDLVTSP
jgi:hypothetical protein